MLNFELRTSWMILRSTMASRPDKVDILHPCASLKWKECTRLPVGMKNAQAVWLGDKLYVGGGFRSGGNDARLYIYTPTTDTWSHVNTPVYWFALVTYHSELVVVGGSERGPASNKLWTLTEHDQLRETLPPMTIERYNASAVEFADNILVAGGVDEGCRSIDITEVYNGHHWAKAQCLPGPCDWMKSTVFNGQWYLYLMGGEGHGKEVYYASLDSLVASCQPREKPLPSVWEILPDVPHEQSSIAVFGNRLIAVGGGGGGYLPPGLISPKPPTASIHAYFPDAQSWVYVGDMPVRLGSTCIAVLPTEKLMVIGGWSGTLQLESCVHKASLNVVFDSDSHFTMKAISCLEQRRSLAELEAHIRPLQSVVGMDKVDFPIDSPLLLLDMWEEGRASLRPTWRHFFWALREIKLNHLADQIEALLSGVAVEQAATSNLDVSPGSEETEGREEDNEHEETKITAEEEKHIAAVQKAMEERGMLDHIIVHGVFVGPARSGKNSLMERLLGRMPSSVSPSTGVAESVVQVKVQKSTTFAANVKELIWSVMDYDDEAIRLVCDSQDTVHQLEKLTVSNDHVYEVLNTTSNTTNVDPTVHDHINASQAVVEKGISLTVDKNNLSVKDSSTQSEVRSVQQDSRLLDSQQHCRLPDSYIPPIEIVKLALRKKGKVPIEILQGDFQKTWSLYLTNTGGQVEFQEVLPLLVSGPSMFFFTFRLDRDLNERYVIEYELSDGTRAEPYTSSLTTIEGILQTLASIAAMGTFIYKGVQRSSVALRPKVFLVGTHKDQLDSKTAKEHIARVDQQLQEAIKSTTHYKDIIEFSSKGQLIFTVNNFSESDTDFKSIRLAVERIVSRREFQMTSPAHWLIFSLALRKLKPKIISYGVAQKIAEQCGVFEDELKEALHFIHSKLGLIRYFPYDDVKDLIVIRPQFLFDKVTDLIVDTFTFEEAGEYSANNFKHKGIFSLSEFEIISSRKNISIKPALFAKLLERLRITAPFQMKGNRMYFFPCVLAHTGIETPLHQLSLICTPVPNLIITFECGYCPKGLPGALITYLMGNEMKSDYRWMLDGDKIFRNQVSFKVGPLDTVVFKILSTYLEIFFISKDFRGRHLRCPKRGVCSSIFQAVDSGIKQVTSDINYVNAQHSFTFPCECQGDHPGRLELLDDKPFCLSCSRTGEQYPLPSGYELWQIYEEYSEPSGHSRYENFIDGREAVGNQSLTPPVLPYYPQRAQLPYLQPGLGTPAGPGQLYNSQPQFANRGVPADLMIQYGYTGHQQTSMPSQQGIVTQHHTIGTGPLLPSENLGIPAFSQGQGSGIGVSINYPHSVDPPTLFGANAGQQYSPPIHLPSRAVPVDQGIQHSYPMIPMRLHQSTPAQYPHYGNSSYYSPTAAPLGGRNAYTVEPALQAAYRSQQDEHIGSPFLLNRLTNTHHPVLLRQLTQHAAIWRIIGTYLGFTQGELNNIQANQFLAMNSPVSWLSAMLSQWLQWAPQDSRGSTNFATLEALKDALDKAGLGVTARELGVNNSI